MWGIAVLHSFRGRSYNSKKSLVSQYLSFSKEKHVWGSPGCSIFCCFHCLFILPKMCRKRIIIAFNCRIFFYALAFMVNSENGQNGFLWHSEPINLLMSTPLKQELPFMLADCAAIKCIICSKAVKLRYHSRCSKKSPFHWNANVKEKEEQIFQPLPR